ncbi:MAG: energy transducer TonB [Desulfomonilaceae bacterium]
MKKTLIAAIVLVLALTLIATASEKIAGIADQMIVDRSTRSKVLNDYTLLTRDTIQRAWTTPTMLNTPGALKGRISVNYIITRSGALEALELVKSSGNPDMDSTLLLAIRSAAPFPPFPDEIAARRLLIRANFIVADVPTLPVTTVEHAVQNGQSSASPTTDQDSKKFIWGAPAGTAGEKTPPTENEAPAAPPQKKYHWGIDLQPPSR